MADNDLTGKVLGSYFLEKKLSEGGMGATYIASKMPYEDIRQLYLDGKLDQLFIDAIKASAKLNRDTKFVELSEQDQFVSQIDWLARRFVELPQEERQAQYDTLRAALSSDVEDVRRVVKVMLPDLVDGTDSGTKDRTLTQEELERRELEEKLSLKERFLQEGSVVNSLKHPNIVRGVEFGVSKEGIPYIAMEYIDGTINVEEECLDVPEILQIVRQVNSALEHGHKQGIVHRDIKPQNILVKKSLESKVIDYGLAKIAEKKGGKDLTKTARFLGTPSFMAPEVCHGEVPDGKTDVYSLGGTAYKWICGENPTNGKSDMNQILAFLVRDTEVNWIKDLGESRRMSSQVKYLVMGMLAKKRENRFSTQSVELMIKDIVENDLYFEKFEDRKIQAKSVSKRIKSKNRFGWIRDNNFELGMLYEQLGWLQDDSADGTRARMNSWSESVKSYKKHLEKNSSSLHARERISERVEMLEVLVKTAHRRLHDLGGQTKTVLPMKKRLTRAAAIVGITGVLAFTGQKIIRDAITEHNVSGAYHSALEAYNNDDLIEADSELSRAVDYAEDLPKNSEHVRNIDNLRSLINDSRNKKTSSEFYSSAKRALDVKNYALARSELEFAVSAALKLSDKHKDFRVEVESYSRVINNVEWYDSAIGEFGKVTGFDKDGTHISGFMENREYSNAVKSLDSIDELLRKIEPHDENFAKLIEKLRADVKSTREITDKFMADIVVYNGLMDQYKKLKEDVDNLAVKLDKNEYFERSSLDDLKDRIGAIDMKLSDRFVVNPDAIGDELSKSRENVRVLYDRIPVIRKDLNAKQLSVVDSSVTGLSSLLEGMKDYTLVTKEKVDQAHSSIQSARSLFDKIDSDADNRGSVLDKLVNAESEYNSIKSNFDAFSGALSKSDLDSRILVLKSYLTFGHVDKADKALSSVEDKSGLESYVSIVSLEKKVADKSTYIKRTPAGLTQSSIDVYAEAVQRCKESQDLSNLTDTISVLGGYGLDVKSANESVDSLKSLYEKFKTASDEEKPAVQTEIDNQYKVLDGLKSASDVLLAEKGVSVPNPADMSALRDAYKSVGLDKKADEERFK